MAQFWAAPGEPTGHLLSGTPTSVGGFDDRGAMVDRYAAAAGADVSEIAYYVAFSLWKLACIAEGIAARVSAGVMGGAVSRSGPEYRAKVQGLAEAALEVLPAR